MNKAAAELAEKQDALREAEKRLAEVNRDLDPERIERLRKAQEGAEAELERAKAEVERLGAELAPLRAERDAALRVIAEATQHQARAEALKLDLEDLESKRDHLSQERDRLRGEVELEHEKLTSTRNAIHSAETERDRALREQLLRM